VTVDIAVFARAPVPGEAKTRLIPKLGATGAAELQLALMRRSVTTALAASLGRVSLWCAPDCRHPSFVACAKDLGVALHPQRGADLGERMFNAFAQLCRQRNAMIIGTDCPALTAETLRIAAGALIEGNDAVVVPAEDGGYVLIGLRRAVASLFHGIPWGRDTVMTETLERLSRAKLRYRELAPSWDVDRPEDFERLSASGLMAPTIAA
jgi:rSAM/selenodomain-associated transferase 1